MQVLKGSILASLAAAFMLAACGGSDDPAPMVASSDTTVTVGTSNGPAIASAVSGTPFTFPGGVPGLGTTGETKVTLESTGGSATPKFNIASGGATATGDLQFGSCVFVIANSTFPAGHPLAAGQTVTVNPCELKVGTQGAPADGTAQSRSAVFVLGSSASTGISVTVTVSSTGAVTINGQAAGSVTLVPVTGS